MKRYIEKYFLFIFIFAISLVNITSTFTLGKIESLSDVKKNPTTKGKVDTEVCKKDDTQIGIAQYSDICRTQCTSTEAKFVQFKKDNKVACDVLAAAARSAEQAKKAQILEAEIKNADLSTKAGFDKIKELFDVTAEEFSLEDFFLNGYSLLRPIQSIGLVPVRVTITPKAPDATKPALLEQLKQRILALAKDASGKPTNLGATLHTAPAPGSLYEAIYKESVAGSIKDNIKRVNTNLGVEITLVPPIDGDILNAQVIAARKAPDTASAIDILLQLDGAKDYISGFEKLSGLEVSYAHIANPVARGAAFVDQKNFVKGLFDTTTADTPCNPYPNKLFAIILNNDPGCRNLLKITVPTTTTAEFGIPEGLVFDHKDPKAHAEREAQAAQAAAATAPTIFFILNTLQIVAELTRYFNPDIASVSDHYLYASEDIRNQLKSAKNVKKFNVSIENYITHSWPANGFVKGALATIFSTANSYTVSLFRVAGDPKSVYFTKKIEGAPAPEASGGGAGGGSTGTGGTGSADVKQP